jgi:hypothetical protein
MSVSYRRGAWLAAFAALGCAATIESSKIEDHARRAVPVAICLKPLPRHAGDGTASHLNPEDYWSMVLPGFDAGSATVDRSVPDCAGRPVFENPELATAEGPRAGTLSVKVDDALVTPAADGLRVVWLRTHRFSDGTAAGPLALVRPREGYAEVYATGFYRGREKDSRFSLERMGPRMLVTAADEGCTGVKPKQSCESKFSVYLMHSGQLLQEARFALDRIEYRSIPGAVETAQVRLTASPAFQPSAMRVSEQLVVTDPSQGVIRKSDLERVFELQRGDRLVSTEESLWSRVMGDAKSTEK